MPWLCILLQSHIHVGWNAAHVYTRVLRVSYEEVFFITKSAILISILFSPCLTFTLFATQSILSHCYRWWLCTQMLRKIFAFCCARQTDSSIVSFRVEKHSKFNLHCVQFASAYIVRLSWNFTRALKYANQHGTMNEEDTSFLMLPNIVETMRAIFFLYFKFIFYHFSKKAGIFQVYQKSMWRKNSCVWAMHTENKQQ